MLLLYVNDIIYGNDTYCKANKSCDEVIDENKEYILNVCVLNSKRKKKHYRSCSEFLKCISARFTIISRICSTNNF